MAERPHPHRRAIAAGTAALLLGFVLALLLAGGDDDRPPGTTPTERTQTTGTPPRATETAPPRDATETALRPPPARDFAAIQATVTLLVESVELGDAAGVCRALGQTPRGSGPEAAQACADRAGIDLQALPGSDELSFDGIEATGDRGRATLSTGDTVSLRRSGGRWRVTGVSS